MFSLSSTSLSLSLSLSSSSLVSPEYVISPSIGIAVFTPAMDFNSDDFPCPGGAKTNVNVPGRKFPRTSLKTFNSVFCFDATPPSLADPLRATRPWRMKRRRRRVRERSRHRACARRFIRIQRQRARKSTRHLHSRRRPSRRALGVQRGDEGFHSFVHERSIRGRLDAVLRDRASHDASPCARARSTSTRRVMCTMMGHT